MAPKTDVLGFINDIYHAIDDGDVWEQESYIQTSALMKQKYPNIVEITGPQMLRDVFTINHPEEFFVNCNRLALSLQKVLTAVCGNSILLQTSPIPFVKPFGIKPTRFPQGRFNYHVACLDPESGTVYDPNLMREPFQLDKPDDFSPYLKKAFLTPHFLLKTAILP
jgi:hypothetical protein